MPTVSNIGNCPLPQALRRRSTQVTHLSASCGKASSRTLCAGDDSYYRAAWADHLPVVRSAASASAKGL
jgi:hypothetical protein